MKRYSFLLATLTGLLCSLSFSAALQAEVKILAFAGSAREDSVNKKLILEAAKIARKEGASVTVIDFKDYPLPFYHADLESTEGMPAKAAQLRQLMINSQAIFIASPEYNGSVSALLKNALDWASRSETGGPSRQAFANKTFLLLSASPGAGGGVRGLSHLRAIITNIGGNVLASQLVVPYAYEAFDEQSELNAVEKKEELRQLIRLALENQEASS